MNTMHKTSTLLCAAILGVVVLAGGHAHADDCDKFPLFNTFYLPGQSGSYALSLRQDRTFTLTDPCGATLCGTFVASDDELALISREGSRHFAYRFDSADNVVFEPTKKDTPNGATLIGRMTPVGRHNEALFVAAQNVAAPVRPVEPFPGGPIVPAVVTTGVRHDEGNHNGWDRDHDGRWDRINGREWDHDRRGDRDNDRNNRWDSRRGHYETRTQRVLVEAAHTDRRWVPAQFEVRVNCWGHRENVQVRPAHWEVFQVPARFETREVKVWVEGR